MRLKGGVLIAPIDTERSPIGDHMLSSWEEALSGVGFQLVPFVSFKDVEEVRAVVVPSMPINIGGEEPVSMNFGTIFTLLAAMNQDVTIFSERPLADNFEPLQNRCPDDPDVRKFGQLIHEIGETVIEQDVSIIQEKLGVR